MKEIEFREWLKSKGISKKIESDCSSRIKRIEKILDSLDIDEEFKYDHFNRLLQYLSEGCINSPYQKSLELKNTYSKYALKCALNKYSLFLEETTSIHS